MILIESKHPSLYSINYKGRDGLISSIEIATGINQIEIEKEDYKYLEKNSFFKSLVNQKVFLVHSNDEKDSKQIPVDPIIETKPKSEDLRKEQQKNNKKNNK